MAGFHHVHQAKVIEGGALSFESIGQINGKFGSAGKTAMRFFSEFFRQAGFLKFTRLMSIADDRKRNSTPALVSFWIVVQRPFIACAVIADGCGTKLPGNERRDERPA